MKDRFQAIGSLLQGALKRFRIERQVLESSCLVLWDRVVGGYLASVTQPERFRGGILYINTRSPSWAQELEFQKAELIGLLNERLGRTAVRDIYFQPKGLKRAPRHSAGAPESPEEFFDWDHIDLSLEDWSQIKDSVAVIADLDLKSRMEDLLVRQRKMQKWKETHGWKPCTRCQALHDTPYSLCPICRLPSW